MTNPSGRNKIAKLLRVAINPFKNNWTESFHFLVIAIAILVSGYWAYHTFEILYQKDTAEANLAKTNSDLSKAKLELKELQDKIDGTISSDISINVEQIALGNAKSGLIITVTVKNNGTQDIDMIWDKTPLKVYKVAHKDDLISNVDVMEPYLYRSLKTNKSEKSIYVKNLHLFVGAKKDLSFFTEVESGHLYYITFNSQVDAITKGHLDKNGKTGTWLSSKFHFVK
jgi:hypothetical protein